MTYNAIEVSNHDGRPVQLYKFQLQGAVWFYTSADRNITYGGDTYECRALSDEGITQDSGAGQDDLTIHVPSDLEVCGLFTGTPPSSPVVVEIRRMHYGDAEAPLQFVGQIDSVRRVDSARSSIRCRALPSFRRQAPRLCWSRNCPRMLYDAGCGVDRTAFDVAGTITALAGATFTAAEIGAQPAGWFDGGIVEWSPLAGVTERRGITSTAGSSATVLGTTDGLTEGLAVTLYPGCDLTAETCDAKFDNIDNFGGIRHMPGKSPFDGDPVF